MQLRIGVSSIALFFSLIAVPCEGFYDYGNLQPTRPAPQCQEGQEQTFGSVIFRCLNGNMQMYQCIIGTERVPKGRTARNGQFLWMCKENGPNEIAITPIACLDEQGGPPHYTGTSNSAFTDQKHYRFDCVKTDKGINVKPIGCVGDQGRVVQPGSKLIVEGLVSTCIKLPNNKLVIESDPIQQPTTPPWQPASEIYPHDGNTQTTMTATTTTTTYPTWSNVDLSPTTDYSAQSETDSTTTVEMTTQWALPTTEWAPPSTQPPATTRPWDQPVSTTGLGQQTQNPMQQFFGQPGGFGGPGLVVINNM